MSGAGCLCRVVGRAIYDSEQYTTNAYLQNWCPFCLTDPGDDSNEAPTPTPSVPTPDPSPGDDDPDTDPDVPTPTPTPVPVPVPTPDPSLDPPREAPSTPLL